MHPPPTDALTVTELTVAYGPVRALRAVSLRVPAGGAVAVLGANGAGKSTLLRAICGVLAFHGGAVRGGRIAADGRDLLGRRPDAIVADGIVQVPEGRQIFARMTVAENLRAGALGARHAAGAHSVRPGSRRRLAEAYDLVMELFPVLAERQRQRAGLLSGGEQQMLAIGRALMARPRLLLLDEPSLGLAPIVIDRIADTIRDIRRQDIALLLIEQNAALALDLATHAYVLEVGKVALSGPSAELAATDDVRRRYLGDNGEVDDVQAAGRTLARWAG